MLHWYTKFLSARRSQHIQGYRIYSARKSAVIRFRLPGIHSDSTGTNCHPSRPRSNDGLYVPKHKAGESAKHALRSVCKHVHRKLAFPLNPRPFVNMAERHYHSDALFHPSQIVNLSVISSGNFGETVSRSRWPNQLVLWRWLVYTYTLDGRLGWS